MSIIRALHRADQNVVAVMKRGDEIQLNEVTPTDGIGWGTLTGQHWNAVEKNEEEAYHCALKIALDEGLFPVDGRRRNVRARDGQAIIDLTEPLWNVPVSCCDTCEGRAEELKTLASLIL